MQFDKINAPSEGQKITVDQGVLSVPDNPIIPFIEGDGTGVDIWAVAVRVFDAAVEKAYGEKRKITWLELYAGDKSNLMYTANTWLPNETIEAIKEYIVAIKGPMTSPVGRHIRSINVTLRHKLDLYACVRPVRYINGVPSPMKRPQDVDMTIFRENTEDIYAGIEFEKGTEGVSALKKFLKDQDLLGKVRFPETASFAIKPVSEEGTHRIVRAAINYAIKNNKPSVTLVHKGNILKFTEGYFAKWGYELAKKEFPDNTITWEECGGNPPPGKILIKDVIADAFFQQILTRPSEYSIIATLNLNGDYITDALVAQVGGIGISPGASINYETGIALFEVTHGTAPKYAGLDKVNPSSIILSGCLMLQYMGWNEAAEKIEKAIEKAIKDKTVTFDFVRFMDDATELKCSEFGDEIVKNM